jgi:2-isopropylmalate synthase
VLGKHSGRHAFKDRAIKMGFELSDEKLNKAFAEFKKLADSKKEIVQDDLFILLTDQQINDNNTPVYELASVQVQYSTQNIPTATVSAYQPTGELITEAAIGAGSVEAIFNTLERIVKGKVHILDYRVTSIGKGRDALGEAVINLSYNGETVTGRDVAQDVLEASAKAYLNAVNRQLVKVGQKVEVVAG